MARKHTESELLQFIELYFDGNSYQTLVNNYNLKLSYTPFRSYVKKFYNWNFISIPTFQEYGFDLVLALFGVLLTLLGVFTALPNTKFKLLMKRYNHMKIINRTLAIGIFSSLSFLILYLFELKSLLQEVLFIFALTETYIAIRRIYTASKYSLLLEGERAKDS